jgi:hypothetical protein
MTEPAPFQLKTDIRGEKHAQLFAEKLQLQEEERKEAVTFHANPLPIADPFVPERSHKPLTEIQPFPSRMEMRLEERKGFEEELLRKQQEEEESNAEREKIRQVLDNRLNV